MSLAECVEAFLGLAMLLPERPPKRMRDQRDNEMIVHGVNRGQEMLRSILENHGTPAARRLADVRADGQERPVQMGDTKLWIKP